MDEVQGIETVYIPEPDRGTLCISSQVGCAMDCTFCATAQQGFNRNLSVAEIVGSGLAGASRIGRIRARADWPQHHQYRVHGHGRAARQLPQCGAGHAIFMDDFGYDLSRRRVTLSTSGLVPQIYKLAEECNVALAVSLHAPNDELRNELVPINRNHPIAELLEACWHYIEQQNGRSITFEYVMLDGINDKPEHARQLARLLKGHPAKLNLIPFNVFPGTRYRRSPAAAIARFARS